MPKVNKRANERMTRNKFEMTTGNKNIDLYNKALLKERKDITKDELEFERNKEDCKFKPTINKSAYLQKSP